MVLEKGVEVPGWMWDMGIKYPGYSALQHLLASRTIYVHKFAWSKLAGYDIGTPETVARIVLSASIDEGLYPLSQQGGCSYWGDHAARKKVWDGLKDVKAGKFVEVVSAGYLLGTDFSNPDHHPQHFVPQSEFETLYDDDGRSQLEGELRRDLARRNGMSNTPRGFIVDASILRDYCDIHGLRFFETAFAARISWMRSEFASPNKADGLEGRLKTA